ncbi:MAG: ribonuclease HI [Anaerolineales bacterium]
MSKRKKSIYLVLKGRQTGVYQEWDGTQGAKAQVEGYAGAIFKSFYTSEEATNWLKSQSVTPLPPALRKWLDDQEKAPHNSASKSLQSIVENHLQGGGIVIFTDGSTLGNPGPGGYAAVILKNQHRQEIRGGFRLTTNNRMELYACIAALETIIAPSNVLIITDSAYVYRATSQGWLQRWIQNGWRRGDGKTVENQDLWQKLHHLHQKHTVKYYWIKGHNATVENERCDRLAVTSAQAPNLPPDPGYRRNHPPPEGTNSIQRRSR